MGCSSSTSTSACTTITKVAPETNDFSDFHVKYVIGEKIGRGAFARVHVATKIGNEFFCDGVLPQERDHENERAVKILDVRGKKRPDVEKLEKLARKEITLWLKVGQHPHCISLYDYFYCSDLCYMVMERCSSSLLQHFELMSELNERSFGKVMAQMLLGIAHCHSARVVHRDVKPDNFMVGGADGETVKLGDFGLSARIPSDGKLKGVFGTAPFMCPEMLSGRSHNEKADVWSFGVIVYTLFFGIFPYMPQVRTSKGMKEAIVEGNTPAFEPIGRSTTNSIVNMRSKNVLNFVRRLLCRDPHSRPSAVDCLNMTYMVAVLVDSHMLGVELPSLRPMVHAAKRVGAFDMREASKESGSGVTTLLGELENHDTQASEAASLPLNRNSARVAESTAKHMEVPSKSRLGCALDVLSNRSTAMGSTSSAPLSCSTSGVSRNRSAFGKSDNSVSSH